MDAAAIGMATSFGMGGANVAAVMTPSLSDVRAGSVDDDALRTKVRTGEIAALAVVGTTGVILWKLTGETLPLLLSASILGMTFLAYEWALRMPQTDKSTNGTPPMRAVLAYK